MLNYEPIPEADLREIEGLYRHSISLPRLRMSGRNLLSALGAAYDEITSLREGLRKSIILGIDINDPLIMHKSGETVASMFREDVPEHNARIDALLGEGGKDATTPE